MAPLRRDALVALSVAALCAAVVAPSGGIWSHVTSPDLHAMYLARFAAATHALFREGRLPLWNPFEYCGIPFLALAQGAVLYPPMWLCFGLLPRFAALQAFYLLHLGLLAFGASAYWRREDAPAAARAAAALLTVGAFANGFLHQGVDHPAFLAGLAWVPVILLCAERAAAGPPLRWSACAALAVAAQWLVGYPELVLDTGVLVGVVLLATPVGSLGRRLAALAIAFCLGTALAAVQIVPLVEAIGESMRTERAAFFQAFRGPVVALGDAVARQYGWLVVGVAVLGVLRPSARWAGWLAATVWGLCALHPPFVLLYRVPPFAAVHVPYAWSHLAPFFVGGLVAAGLREGRRRLGPALGACLALAVAVYAGGLLCAGSRPAPFVATASRPLDGVDAGLRTFADLRRVATAPGRWVAREGTLLGVPTTLRMPFVVGWEPVLSPRRLTQLLTRGAGWAHPELAAPRDTADVILRHPALFAALGVGYAVLPADRAADLRAAGFRVVAAVPPEEILVYRRPAPQAAVVAPLHVGDDDEAQLAAMRAPSFDPSRTAVVAEPVTFDPPPAPGPAGAGPRPAARITAYHPERVEILARSPVPALLVLADTHFPGWVATVDGVPARIARANHALRGVPLAPGRHRVVFAYRPASVRIGAAASGVAALVVLALLVPRRRARPARGG